MSSFPLGQTLNNTQNGTSVAASVSVNISNGGFAVVIDSFSAKVASVNAANPAFTSSVNIIVNGAVTVYQNVLVLPAALIGSDSFSEDDLNILCPIGESVTAQFVAAAVPDIYEVITLKWHAI